LIKDLPFDFSTTIHTFNDFQNYLATTKQYHPWS